MDSRIQRLTVSLCGGLALLGGLLLPTAWANAQDAGLFPVSGIMALDYQTIEVPGESSIDLLGVHYLHQLNDWFYLGLGAHAPLFRGEYGGFMTFDATAHIRKRMIGQWYLDAGAALGGGGGGSSIEQSKALSGNGGFSKSYVGVSYQFPQFALGLNYTKMHFFRSLIDDEQLGVYVQKPLSFRLGSYSRPPAPKARVSDSQESSKAKSKIAVELNHLKQFSPEASYKGSMELLSLQYSHFVGENAYLFVQVDAGVHGLPLYNQLLGGVGYEHAISAGMKAFAQLGVGSGGYAPAEVDTGPGLLLYPKLGLEYMAKPDLGFSLVGGYLAAPKGSSKNATLGLAMNYYLGGSGQSGQIATVEGRDPRRIRFSLNQETKFNAKIKGEDHDDLHLLSAQFDYLLNDRWYAPIQISFAYNEYRGYPGYGEIYLGLGLQTQPMLNGKVEWFAQTLVGANVTGVLVTPSVGLNYAVNEQFAVLAKAGASRSIDSVNRHSFRSYNVGLGLTYRFSIPSL